MTRIAIIGSGLAGVACAKGLISRGVKPIFLDVGKKLEGSREEIVSRLKSIDPSEWEKSDLEFITSNPTVKGEKFPKKLSFGSDYFYGSSTECAPIEVDSQNPPFSFAKGGLGIGWGASALPPCEKDLVDWPIKAEQLSPYFHRLLNDIPYSAVDDGLSKYFPIFSDSPEPLRITSGNSELLRKMSKSKSLEKQEVAFGQSRMLIRSKDGDGGLGCKYCGYCMSGCVYGSIFNPSDELDRMVSRGEVEYRDNALVTRLSENEKQVTVFFYDKETSENLSLDFDKVFLAAGALSSARIILQSKEIFDKTIKLHTTTGFVLPMFRLRSSPLEWPLVNSEPGVFLEYKLGASHHWIHSQINTPNEMVLEYLGIRAEGKGISQRLRRKLAEHIIIAHCNLHSRYPENGYNLTLKRGKSESEIGHLLSTPFHDPRSKKIIARASRKMFSLGLKFGCVGILPFVRTSTDGYHAGGTLPMVKKPKKETETNLLGNPKNWERVHVVDSSVFPSIPGTTIGLLAMANALRVASEAEI